MKKYIVMYGIIALIFVMACVKSYRMQNSIVYYEDYTVTPNDTVWSIATDIADDDIDVRYIENKIQATNQIQNNVIYPGDKLFVPVVKK